jgi:alpha-galactosidase
MLEHNMQKTSKGQIDPFSSMCYGIALTQKIETDAIDEIVKNDIGIEYYWTDAGWYNSEGGNWTKVGTCHSDPARYPGTYRAVSDHAHSGGLKTVLWFEAERVSPGSKLSKFKNWLLTLPDDKKSYRSDRMYPEYFFKNGQFAIMESHRNQLNSGDCLFNLGDGEARKYLTELISEAIETYDIDCYRTDFNIAPLEFWLSADEENRHGMTENKYVTGFLKFWDDLQGRFPDVVFDTCSSGGRRNDLETLRRALPLLRSDFQVNPVCAVGNQGHTYGLSSWIPYAGTGCPTDDMYLFRSHLCPFMGIGHNADKTKWKKAVSDWKAVKTHFLGDYYPLTGYSLSEQKWIAWQFHTPNEQSGMAQLFRRSNCAENTFKLKLKALVPEAEYELASLDEGSPMRYKGSHLMGEGIRVTLRNAPGAAIIVYNKLR